MISQSPPSFLQFCNTDGNSSITSYNYNKSATILKSMASSAGRHYHHHKHQHHHHHHGTRKVMVAGIASSSSGGCAGAPGLSKRSLTRKDHQRSSLRYTRTLDIIHEEEYDGDGDDNSNNYEGDDSSVDCCSVDDSSSHSSNSVIITTDFWHSQRSLKKSATSVSLESLVLDSNNNHRSYNMSGNERDQALAEDNCDFDNFFLDDWDM